MTFLVYHAGFDTSVKEGPYDAQAKSGVDVLVRSMQEAGNPTNVYAELGSTWRYVMRDPDQAAHLLGKLLVSLRRRPRAVGHRLHLVRQPAGPDPGLPRVSDQPRVPAAPRLPSADAAAQAQGVRAQCAQVYGLKPDAMRGKLAKDRVQKSKLDYLNDPQPTFATYGPRTRRSGSRCASGAAARRDVLAGGAERRLATRCHQLVEERQRPLCSGSGQSRTGPGTHGLGHLAVIQAHETSRMDDRFKGIADVARRRHSATQASGR